MRSRTICISISITYQCSYKEVSSLYASLQISPTPQATTPMQRPAILVDDLSYTSHNRACCFCGTSPILEANCRVALSRKSRMKKCLICSETSLQHAAVKKKTTFQNFLIPPRASASKRKRPCSQRPEILGKSLLRPLPQTRFRYKVIHTGQCQQQPSTRRTSSTCPLGAMSH